MPISEFRESGPDITEKDIDALEQTIGHQLPLCYRDFLLQVNGGRPYPEESFWFRPEKPEGGSLLSYFYAVKHDRKTLTIAQRQYAFRNRIPRDLLPIAVDAGGNKICMGVSPENRGKIYFWAQDDERETVGYDNVIPLADDFDTFVQGFFDAQRDGWES